MHYIYVYIDFKRILNPQGTISFSIPQGIKITKIGLRRFSNDYPGERLPAIWPKALCSYHVQMEVVRITTDNSPFAF